MSLTTLLVALGLWLAVEGLLFAAFPQVARRSAFEIARMAPERLRVVGLALATIGVIVIWLCQ